MSLWSSIRVAFTLYHSGMEPEIAEIAMPRNKKAPQHKLRRISLLSIWGSMFFHRLFRAWGRHFVLTCYKTNHTLYGLLINNSEGIRLDSFSSSTMLIGMAMYCVWASVFGKTVSLNQSHLVIYLLPTVAYMLQGQSWVIVTETYGSQSLKYLLSDPSQKKFINPWNRRTKQQSLILPG